MDEKRASNPPVDREIVHDFTFRAHPRHASTRPGPRPLLFAFGLGDALAQTPASVGIPGNYQSETGCPGDWDPGCGATQLVYDANGDVWKNTFNIPAAGAWEYKVALNGSWDVNYGLHAQQNGPNIPLTTSGSPQGVTFYYDHKTHWVTDNVRSIIATVPGSFQSEIGCPGDWDPGCFRSWLQDINDTSIYSFSTSAIPAGSYECKVALNGTWDVNYGAGGVQNGANIGFTVPANGMDVVFQWNSVTRDLRVVVGGIHGDLTKAQAYWLSKDTIAWNVPTDTVVSLFTDPEGALTIDGPGVVPGAQTHSWTLANDPAGLSAALKAKFPHLANLPAFKLPPEAVAAAANSLKGQLAVGAVRGVQGVDATSLQIPGVLDDLYAANAGPVTLGPSFRNGMATLRVWAPTARSLKLRLFADSSTNDFASYAMTLDAASGIWSYTAPASSLEGRYYLYEAQVYVRSTNKVETNVVTDPYSVSLARNSTRSQVVSLDDSSLQPRGWRALRKPWLAAPEDIVLYELHVRDFSATDQTVPENLRGTFAAFTQKKSDGMKHLALLGAAGVTHVHLLPAFDFATTNEDRSAWQSPSLDVLAGLPGGFHGTAIAGCRHRRSRCLQLGLRPAALQRARRQLRHGSRWLRARARVPRDGAVSEPERPARGDGRGLQPHQLRRPEYQFHSRQAGSGLLPPPQR